MSLIERFRAWRRGERRVEPGAARGRIYARPEEGGSVRAKVKLEAAVSARVYRAAEDAWYKVDPKTGELEKE